MLHVGVTGGIGSGKTTFLKVWEENGIPVVNTDKLAKEIMNSDPRMRNKIKRLFGLNSYHDNNEINREYLADEVFEKGRINELNAIVHPAVYQELEKRKEQAKIKGAKLFAHESALILSADSPDICDIIILLTSSENERIQRVTERDLSDSRQVYERMQKQPDFERLHDKSDIVIHNDGTIQQLREISLKTLEQLLANRIAIPDDENC